MKIVIAGGTGFIGNALVRRLLELEHRVVVATRDPEHARKSLPPKVEVTSWDGEDPDMIAHVIEGSDTVINLAGENVAQGRWTAFKKRRILNSRLNATRAIVAAIRRAENGPSVLLNASAVGYYGGTFNGEVLTESRRSGQGFLAMVCRQWESTAKEVEKIGVRLVILRIGVVLGNQGGALPKMAFPFRFFAGGHVGSGKQWVPWIHIDDAVGIIVYSAEHSLIHGPVNVCAPEPTSMRRLCKAIGRSVNRPSWMHIPSFALRLGLGDMAEMLLGSVRAIPSRIKKAGFRFQFPQVEDALSDLLHPYGY